MYHQKTLARVQQMNAETTEERVCLDCDEKFISLSAANRICDACKVKRLRVRLPRSYIIQDDFLRDFYRPSNI